MKRILMLLLTLLVTGCEEFIHTESSLSDNSSSLFSSSSAYPSIDSSSTSIDESLVKEIVINDENYNNIGYYSTGNYTNNYGNNDMNMIGSTSFEHYRAVVLNGGVAELLPYFDTKDDGTVPGSLYNVTKIVDMVKIGVRYMNDSSTGDGISLSYGDDVDLINKSTMKAITSYQYVEFDVGLADFFKIETTGKRLSLLEIKIFYLGEEGNKSNNYFSSGEGDYRLNPTKFSGDLISGESTISVPAKVEINEDGTYKIVENKTYTYYSFEYVENNPEYADEAAMIDPIDVAAYYIAFGEYPANYANRSYISTCFAVFGKNTRQVSQIYDRTDGYVNAVPDDTSNIQYVEFDIAIGDTYIDNYGNISRGVGRVVMFFSGFAADGYDNSPVAVYTDDHYATFQEYLNTGSYGKRFNAQSNSTKYIWGLTNTLN